MPTLDAPDHPLSLILKRAFAAQIEVGEVDLVLLDSGQECEIQSDEWTLHLEGWPVTMAFIALDDEPSAVRDRQAALDAALDNQNLASLRHANILLNNAIVAALVDSGDEVSALVATAIAMTNEDAGAIADEQEA